MKNHSKTNLTGNHFYLDKKTIPEEGILSFSVSGKELQAKILTYSNVFFYMLVESGTAIFTVNDKTYSVCPSTLVVYAPEYTGQLSRTSSDFQCDILIVSKYFLDTLPASDSMYKHIAKVMLRQRQVNPLNESQRLVLSESIQQIRNKLRLDHHHLRHEIVQNVLVTFLLEISNIWIENHWDVLKEYQQMRYEYILKNFMNLLMQNFRKEHLVPYYADQLNISPQYLSLIIKRLTGRTSSQFIFERLYCEARTLLNRPDLSIKEISEQLCFSDQSAFGKFFKKHSGLSPVEFRKKMLNHRGL